MKIERDKGFNPITVIIETKDEAADLIRAIGASDTWSRGGAAVKLYNFLDAALDEGQA